MLCRFHNDNDGQHDPVSMSEGKKFEIKKPVVVATEPAGHDGMH
jgi:hypothetical protein